MSNLKTPKDILMEIVYEECRINPDNIDFEDDDMTKEEIIKATNVIVMITSFTISFFENRFAREFKHYKYDTTKASDEFICRRNLELFRFYIEEILTLESKLSLTNIDKDYFPMAQTYLKNTHHTLCMQFNDKIKSLI